MKRNIKAVGITLLILIGVCGLSWTIITYTEQVVKVFAGANIVALIIMMFLLVRNRIK
jgi:hypothetical protein